MSPRRLAVALGLVLFAGSAPAAPDVELRRIDAGALGAVRRNDTSKLRLISVWATWCAPCLVELPDIVAVDRAFRGRRFETVTISADEAGRHDKALAVLRGAGVRATNYRFDGELAALTRGLDATWTGGMPFVLLVAPGGEVLMRNEGTLEVDRLRRTIEAWLRDR